MRFGSEADESLHTALFQIEARVRREFSKQKDRVLSFIGYAAISQFVNVMVQAFVLFCALVDLSRGANLIPPSAVVLPCSLGVLLVAAGTIAQVLARSGAAGVRARMHRAPRISA